MIKDTVKNTKIIDSGRFYKKNEEIGLRYYQLPKALFNNPKYRGLSLGAKSMYAILRDRQELSISNNYKSEDKWVDEDGNIYLLFKIDPAMDDTRNVDDKESRELSLTELLEIDRKTVMRYKKELVHYKLIIDKRMGQGKTNRMYVLKPELSELVPKNVEIYKKPQNGTSDSLEKGLLVVQKGDGIDTYNIDTDIIDTLSVNQVTKKTSQPIQENKNGQTEYKNIKVRFNDMLKFNDLKISHSIDKKLIDEIEMNILEMYFNEYTVIQGKRQSQEIMRSALMRLTYWHLETLIAKYREVSSETRIKNTKAYTQTMIYNIAFENELAIINELKYVGAI